MVELWLAEIKMNSVNVPFNMDRSIRLVMNTENLPWVNSYHPQVLRKSLEREKEESGEVTSVVKYEPLSTFPPHNHPFGEEIFVLEGEFADEYGTYPRGTYLRNPPGSSHSPFSEKGCILFVKLNQFSKEDTQRIIINTSEAEWLQGQGNLRVMPLHEFGGISAALVLWPKGSRFQRHRHWGGEEIFVLEGIFQDELGSYPKGTWLRNPHLSAHDPFSDHGCKIFVKVGGLIE